MMQDLSMEVEDGGKKKSSSHVVVVPGEHVTIEQGFLRGHGTYVRKLEGDEEEVDENGDEATELVASVTGIVERVNKLISVRPLRARYGGEVGDVIVGRIVSVEPKRWKVEVNARQDAILMLGSVNLPGGAQRRRTLEDQLQMRQVYREGDVISAEVAQFYQDGSMMIQTRSLKYGKLLNGVFLQIPCALVKRLKQHFVTLPCGVNAIFGHNGGIWLTESHDDLSSNDDRSKSTEVIESQKLALAERLATAQVREKIARVRNALMVLSDAHKAVHPDHVNKIVDMSIQNGMQARDMLIPENAAVLVGQL